MFQVIGQTKATPSIQSGKYYNIKTADGTLKIVPKLTFARGLKFNGSNAQLSSTPDSFTLVLAK